MRRDLTMVCWKSKKFWLGRIVERPEIMTQGQTLEELEANLEDAYLLMTSDDSVEGTEHD